jgi:putative transposase
MPRKKCSQEQIIYALRQVEAGTKIGEVCRQLGVSEQSYFRWKKQYAGLGLSELRRLKQLEEENATLKLSSAGAVCRTLRPFNSWLRSGYALSHPRITNPTQPCINPQQPARTYAAHDSIRAILTRPSA